MTANATRIRRHRERKAEGKAALTIEVDLFRLTAMLSESGFLEQWDEDKRSKIEEATARFLAQAIDEHERNA
jgi:hypothetical protein